MNNLWIARDFLGRRSLLCRRSSDSFITFCSVRIDNEDDWQEVPALGIYKIHTEDDQLTIDCYPWLQADGELFWPGDLPISLAGIEVNVKYDEGVKIPVNNDFNTSLPILDDNSHGTEISKPKQTVAASTGLLYRDVTDHHLSLSRQLIEHLSDAVRVRCEATPLTPEGACPSRSNVAILFSGGIDSLMIAILADRHVPENKSIDLINVAFERIRHMKKGQRLIFIKISYDNFVCLNSEGNYDGADRKTGYSGLDELRKLVPDREWRFVEVDVTLQELQQERKNHVADLLFPLVTILDDSIGCAIWFAARGVGHLKGETQEYISNSQILLLGMGADEQLAGYSRHRTQYEKNGYKGVIDEINMEIKRISSRNLGRDDRITADLSKEARFPYLDERFMSFLNNLLITDKVDFNLPRGVGEKRILRIAANELGLCNGALLCKRAIQFGSSIAKMENHKERDASMRSQRL